MIMAVGLSAARVIEGNSLIIAQRRPAGSLVTVFVNALGPHAGKIGQLQHGSSLGKGRTARQQHEQRRKEAHGIP
jgi:hypothetical protein